MSDMYNSIKITTAKGFALPTILIASIVMLLVLTTAVAAVVATRNALDDQRYTQFAKEATESGTAKAQACLRQSNYIAQWTDANPLRPNTDCSGNVISSMSPYVMDTPQLKSTFVVPAPDTLANGVQQVSAQGSLDRVRASNGDVWKSYDSSSYALVTAQVMFNNVTFGYTGAGGAFFGTIGPQGNVSALGYNGNGQLGNGTTSSATKPRSFALPTVTYASSLYTNFLSVGYMMFAITTDGALYGAGSNSNGQLGNGTVSVSQPNPVRFNLPVGVKAKYVSMLPGNTYVIADNNNIYAAGACAYGALGSNYVISGCSDQSTPVRVSLPAPNMSDPNTLPVASSDWVQSTNLATDRWNAYVRMQGGRVYGWGDNYQGQLANGTLTPSSVPVQLGSFGDPGQPKATQVAFDGDAIYILGDDGKVRAAGMNLYGQLGGSMSPVGSSTGYCIDNPNNSTTPGTRLRIWGCNNSTAQKLEWQYDGSIKFRPTSSTELCIDNANNASANGNPIRTWGCNGTVAQKWEMRNDGSIYNASSGKCLDNPGNSSTQGTELQLYDCNGTPAQTWPLYPALTLSTVPIPASSGRVKRITADQWATLYLTEDGKVWGAGSNLAGQLGNGTNKKFSPALSQFILPAGRTAVDFYTTKTGVDTTMDANTYVILDDGSVMGAGGNVYGQIGIGTTSQNEPTPRKMNLPATVKAKSVQTGFGTTVILTRDGKIYTVGNNNYGQLGDGTTNNNSTPRANIYTNIVPTTIY